MTDDITHKDHYISIVAEEKEFLDKDYNDFFVDTHKYIGTIHKVMIRTSSDGCISVFEPGYVTSSYRYYDFTSFFCDWNIITRRVLIEKVGCCI